MKTIDATSTLATIEPIIPPDKPGLYWVLAGGNILGIANVEGKAPYLRVSAVWLPNAIDFEGKPYLITDANEIAKIVNSWGPEVV